VAEASVVVLAVKPRQAADVLAGLRGHLAPGAVLISVLAGVTTEALAAPLGGAPPVVRAMPNTPALVDEGATALAPGRHATGHHLALARALFESVGRVEESSRRTSWTR
jgi:pyrroline-5-carboxylate reductase